MSNFGKLGLSVNWSAGAGGRNSKTELSEKFFGGYYNFSRKLQLAFGGPESENWEDEEVTKRFIDWADTINNINDIITVMSLKKANKAVFNQLKTYLVDLTLAIEELSSNPKYDGEKWRKERTIAADAFKTVPYPEELKDLDKEFRPDSIGCIRVSGKWIEPIFRTTTDGKTKCFWRQSSDRAPKPLKTVDDLANWIGSQIKYTSTFDPTTFLS